MGEDTKEWARQSLLLLIRETNQILVLVRDLSTSVKGLEDNICGRKAGEDVEREEN